MHIAEQESSYNIEGVKKWKLRKFCEAGMWAGVRPGNEMNRIRKTGKCTTPTQTPHRYVNEDPVFFYQSRLEPFPKVGCLASEFLHEIFVLTNLSGVMSNGFSNTKLFLV